MKIPVVLLGLAASAALALDPPEVEFSTAKARDAQAQYTKAAARLKAEYEAKLKKAKEDYQKGLENALRDARKRKDKAEEDRIGAGLEQVKEEIAALGAARVDPKATRKIGEYTFSTHAGKSMKDAVVILDAEDSAGAVDAQRQWLTASYPRHTKTKQALLHDGGKTYDLITLDGPDGKELQIYFDITKCFGLPKG